MTESEAGRGPVELLLLRHGESEGERARRAGPDQVPERFWDRHPDSWQLTGRGHEQARQAGGRLRAAGYVDFDRYVTSPALRAQQTAADLRLPRSRWRPEPGLAARDWGPAVARMTPSQRAAWTARTAVEAAEDPWSWRPPGGESLTMVRRRVRTFLAGAGVAGRQLLVTHAEVMIAARALLDPEADLARPVGNLAAVAYSRRSPVTGTVAGYFGWVWEADLADEAVPGWRPVSSPVFFLGLAAGGDTDGV